MNKFLSQTFIFSLVLTMLFSCKPNAPKSVEAFVGQILEPVSITSNLGFDLGEMITTDDATDVTITITNNSSEVIKSIAYGFDTSENIFDYKANMEGVVSAPGAGGTCTDTLDPGKSCTFAMSLVPRKAGSFKVPGTISYLNRVEAQTKDVTFTLISGQPASVVFTNNISNYTLGILEQTEAIERFIDLEVKNAGGLPARDFTVSIVNSDISGAFKLISHNCPKVLMMNQICQARISYTPTNNNYTDPETIFTGTLTFDYLKDPSDNPASLNGYFSFTSSTIEGKFKTNYATTDFGPDPIVAGNKKSKMVQLTNMGYREGILKQLIFKKGGSTIATCDKGTDSILNCHKSSLAEFPFIIEDISACFEREVLSYLATTGGSPNCIFKITYWPSSTYTKSDHPNYDYDNSDPTLPSYTDISFFYDSRWKDNYTPKTIDHVFNILANFLAKAKLELATIEINGLIITGSDIVKTADTAVVKLGRLAKIAAGNAGVYYPVFVTYRNIGEVDANLVKITDGKTTPTTIISMTETTPGSPRAINSFYPMVQEVGCETIAASQDVTLPGPCAFNYNLSPIKQATEAAEDVLMYDNVTDPANKYKSFNITYTDGTNFNDDGTASTAQKLTTNFTSLLVAKGLLSITAPASFGTLVNGQRSVNSMTLKNIGTGKIMALQYDSTATLEVPSAGVSSTRSGAAKNIPAYPYRLSTYSSNSESLPAGSDLDCYNLLRPSIPATFTIDPFGAGDQAKMLDEGQTCSLRIEAKLPSNSATKINTINPASNEYTRYWADGINNTSDIWMSPTTISIGAVTSKLFYWDGDDYSAHDIASTAILGYIHNTPAITLSSGWKSPAMLYISKLEPIASTVLFRPAITYPNVSDTFPAITSVTGSTTPITLLANTDMTLTTASAVALRSASVKGFYNTLDSSFNGSSVSTPMVYMGSVKTSTDLSATVSFANSGSEVSTGTNLIDNGGDAGFTIVKFSNFVGANITNTATGVSGNTFDIIFKVNSASTGTLKHCYDVAYTSVIATRDYKFCLVADVISTMGKLEVSYKGTDVTWNTTSPAHFDITENSTVTTMNTPYNKLSTCDSFNTCSNPTAPEDILSFSTVFSSATTCVPAYNCQFDKKIVTLKNTGTAPLSDLKMDLTQNPNGSYVANSTLLKLMSSTECANPTHAFSTIQNKIAVCQSEIDACNNLAAGSTCTLNFYYTPTSIITANGSNMLVFSYRAENHGSSTNSSYVNQYVPIKYEGLAAASPTAYLYARAGIETINASTAPATLSTSQSITATSVINWSDPTISTKPNDTSYPLSLGSYTYSGGTNIMSSNFLLDSLSKTMSFYVNLKNTTSMRISFLKANPSPTTASWNQVYPPWNSSTSSWTTYDSKYGISKATIYASEGCFYGEVKNDNTVVDSDKGFNSTTEGAGFTTKRCQLRVDFKGDITYPTCTSSSKTVAIGGDINSSCNPYVFYIPYWSYKRSTYDNLKLNITGFIEPYRSAYDLSASVTNITSTYLNSTSSRITFTIPNAITTSVAGAGTIHHYRVFWAKDQSQLRSTIIFNTSAAKNTSLCYTDTTDATLPKTITLSSCSTSPGLNITPGAYWFIKVMAVRTTDIGLPNQSEVSTFMSDPKMPIVMIPTTPNNNMVYVDALKSFIDNALIDTLTYNFTNAVSKCSNSANNLGMGNGGSTLQNPRTLINSVVWNYISQGLVPSTGYPSNEPGYRPQWLSDAATDIISPLSIKLYDGSSLAGGFPNYSSSKNSDVNATYKIAYNRGSPPATQLNMFVGGDDVSAYAKGVFYSYPGNKAAYVRCYIPILCPASGALSTTKLKDNACILKY